MKESVISLNQELIERNGEVYALRHENKALKDALRMRQFNYNTIKDNDADMNFFTGLSCAALFMWIVTLVKSKVRPLTKSLSIEDHVLVVLMKLKLGLLNKDIAYRFNVPVHVISRIYRAWLPVLATCMAPIIVWPSRAALRSNLPDGFRKKFRDCVTIIDCCEIFMERPKNLTARAITWSNYKHNNTIKYLIGITPAGAVSFLSKGWGGRVSDKMITMESGFLGKLNYGDCVLADRGFQIQDELATVGATLRIPSFTKGKSQLSARDVATSRQLSNVRIHVERVIGRVKKFRILQSTIPVSQVDLLDNVMVVCSALTNMNRSVVNK